MDAERQKQPKDVRDMPIRKPSDPLPSVFNSVPHSGFTTRSGVREGRGAARDKHSMARLRRKN
jgi:hypothetical protein